MSTEPKPARTQLMVILDSNALFVPLKFKIDIFEELKSLLNSKYEPILLSCVLEELQKLAEDGLPKVRKEATFALALAKKCKMVKVDKRSVESVDDVIVNVAGERMCPVFTNDRVLRKRLRDINVPVIYVRQKSRLEIDGRLSYCSSL